MPSPGRSPRSTVSEEASSPFCTAASAAPSRAAQARAAPAPVTTSGSPAPSTRPARRRRPGRRRLGSRGEAGGLHQGRRRGDGKALGVSRSAPPGPAPGRPGTGPRAPRRSGLVSRRKVPLELPTSRTMSRSPRALSTACRPETKPSVGKVMSPISRPSRLSPSRRRERRAAHPALEQLDDAELVTRDRASPRRSCRPRPGSPAGMDSSSSRCRPSRSSPPTGSSRSALRRAKTPLPPASVLDRQALAGEEEAHLHRRDERVVRQGRDLPGSQRSGSRPAMGTDISGPPSARTTRSRTRGRRCGWRWRHQGVRGLETPQRGQVTIARHVQSSARRAWERRPRP